VDPSLILFLVLAVSVLALIAFAILMFKTVPRSPVVVQDEKVASGDAGEHAAPGRPPWWTRPSSWILITALFLFIGLFVTPKIFGGVFLFFPFLWLRGPRRRRPGDSPHHR
jgi:formate hydrogenlyase subunit 4